MDDSQALSLYRGSSTRSQFDSASPPSPLPHSAAAKAARTSGKSGYLRSRALPPPPAATLRQGRLQSQASGCREMQAYSQSGWLITRHEEGWPQQTNNPQPDQCMLCIA